MDHLKARPTSAAQRTAHQPDSLTTRDGTALPVWNGDAADPIAYLASVIDLLPGSRRATEE